jgi:predicted amino acid racemase
MTAPRLEVDLGKVAHNARTLVDRLGRRGIAVTGVTKGTLGSPGIARLLTAAGVARLGESRLENIDALRAAGVTDPITLIRSPMLSQVDRVVQVADASCNTERIVLEALSTAARARGRVHGVVLMVEMGDLREGILPRNLAELVTLTASLPHLRLDGVGTNLACQSGMAPDARNMEELSALVDAVEVASAVHIGLVSGGNSANLDWAFGGTAVGRVNDLRLGESILLGREALRGRSIEGLHTDAFTVVAEVIEVQVKPSLPWGEMTRTAFGGRRRATDHGDVDQAILALGHQDVEPDGLIPPVGITVLGASSDHLVVDAGTHRLAVGDEVRFQRDNRTLLRAMTTPFVTKVEHGSPDPAYRPTRVLRRPASCLSPAAT